MIEEFEEEIQNRKNAEGDDNLEENIQHISIAGDLSPRHTSSLKSRAKKERYILYVHVQTRRNKDKSTSFEQLIQKCCLEY